MACPRLCNKLFFSALGTRSGASVTLRKTLHTCWIRSLQFRRSLQVAMHPKLYCKSGDTEYLKIAIVIEWLKVSPGQITIVQVTGILTDTYKHTDQDEHKSKLYKALFPVLEIADNQFLHPANKIIWHLFEKYSSTRMTHSTVEVSKWIEWEANVLKPAVTLAVKNEGNSEDLKTQLAYINSKFKADQQYILGNRTIADAVIFGSFYPVLMKESSTSSELHSLYQAVSTWFKCMEISPDVSVALRKAASVHGQAVYIDFIKSNYAGMEDAIAGRSDKPSTKGTVTEQEILAARKAWMKSSNDIPGLTERKHPILPSNGERNILITSALPYVNNVPHLGNIIGCVLSADVFARYCRLCNYNTLYICGTDEYGTATETKALEEGLTPAEICDKYFKEHAQIYKWFNIDFDYFGRTTTPEQTKIAQDIFWHLYHNNFITSDVVKQLKCMSCDRFLADRFVEGICPHCSYYDARGDQCDKCGKLINAIDLKHPRCKICNSEPEVKSSQHVFLDLPKLEKSVFEWSKGSYTNGVWSSNAKTVTSTWIRDGLKPRCISRDLTWGTPVPLEGYQNKVFYVWFDAPIGYLSITACYTKEWEKWWKNPEQVQLYQFMAKDNIPFHTVVFPCSLIGTKENYTLLNHISSTEYLNYEDGKFSKSRGVGVFGNDAQQTGISADVYRFYLLYVRPETQDSTFSWNDLALKHNSELLNNLGNFVYRTLSFIKKYFDGEIPAGEVTDDSLLMMALVTKELKMYIESMEALRLREGLKFILNISRLGNGFIQTHEPWKLMKGTAAEQANAGSLLNLCANITCLLSAMLHPFMPDVSAQIQDQLQTSRETSVILDYFTPFMKRGHKIGEPVPLFTKIEAETVLKLKQQFKGKQNTATEPTAKKNSNKAATPGQIKA